MNIAKVGPDGLPVWDREDGETSDYGFDWVDWLAARGGAVLTGSTWNVPAGLTYSAANDEINGTQTAFWVSGGGVKGTRHYVVNTITTDKGHIEKQALWLVMR